MILDETLIMSFRHAIVKEELITKYANYNGKNKYNAICSAMDWVEISAKYINKHELTNASSPDTIDVLAYLLCVDNIVEAVVQLNRVLLDTNHSFCRC